MRRIARNAKVARVTVLSLVVVQVPVRLIIVHVVIHLWVPLALNLDSRMASVLMLVVLVTGHAVAAILVRCVGFRLRRLDLWEVELPHREVADEFARGANRWGVGHLAHRLSDDRSEARTKVETRAHTSKGGAEGKEGEAVGGRGGG